MRFSLSLASPEDLDLLVSHRLSMWLDIHPELEQGVKEMDGLTRRWVKRELARGKLVGFIVRAAGGRVAGSGCIWLRNEQPRPNNPRGEAPYLLSMYTNKEFRRKGVARLVVKRALKWSKENGYDRVNLHASPMGKPLYESMGFEPTTEMRLKL